MISPNAPSFFIIILNTFLILANTELHPNFKSWNIRQKIGMGFLTFGIIEKFYGLVLAGKTYNITYAQIGIISWVIGVGMCFLSFQNVLKVGESKEKTQ